MKSYRILQYPRESYKIIQDWYGILDKPETTPQHFVKFLPVESYKVLQDLTGC